MGLNEEEANLLFKMMRGESSVRSITFIERLALSELEPTNFFAALDKIVVLDFGVGYGVRDVSESEIQVANNFYKAVATGTNLKKLHFSLDCLGRHLDRQLLGRMVTQVEEVHIYQDLYPKARYKICLRVLLKQSQLLRQTCP